MNSTTISHLLQIKYVAPRRSGGVYTVSLKDKETSSSETQGQIVGTKKSLNGRKNIWHEEK